MKNRCGLLILALMISPITNAQEPFVFNYSGLGTTPIGIELKRLSATWSPRTSPGKVKTFLENFRAAQQSGTDTRQALEGAGLSCAPPPAQTCSYSGIYMYELRRNSGKVERSANRMDITVDLAQEPWEIKATSQFLYGGPANWGQY